MLTELFVRDLALIERCSVTLGPGLNVLTGETGAGKSLVVGALTLLLGGRARSGLVRRGADAALVEGRFELRGPAGERVRAWLAEHLPEVAADVAESAEDGGAPELILGRRLSAEGKSRAHVDQRPVPLRTLRELLPLLLEIHGQHEHQRLFDPAEQLALLDAYGGLGESVEAYAAARARWRSCGEQLFAIEERAGERRDRLDLLRFQLGEIRAVAPDADERAALGRERELLRHAGALRSELGAVLGELSEADDALLDRLRRAHAATERWRRAVADLGGVAEDLQEAALRVEEAVRGLQGFVDGVEVDPARLEVVEERLAELERLERKHATDAAGLARLADEFEAQIAALEGEEESREELDRELAAARAELSRRADALRAAREKLAKPLARDVQRELGALGLPKARFELHREEAAPRPGDSPNADPRRAAFDAEARHFGPLGTGRFEFRLAANPGEPLAPLRHVASGGEAARIALALRTVLAAGDAGRTLVFDEIDAGVGGRLGPAVGNHLRALGEHHQVLCVTHLPAIAALADQHVRVAKQTRGGRTRTSVATLAGDDRVDEVADMIAGGAAHETARAEARRLLAEPG